MNCHANKSIECTVKQCANHCGTENYCSLDSILVGTHECDPTVDLRIQAVAGFLRARRPGERAQLASLSRAAHQLAEDKHGHRRPADVAVADKQNGFQAKRRPSSFHNSFLF